ncbi:hypothetical protein SLA2020_260390 [Shorea laevis]
MDDSEATLLTFYSPRLAELAWGARGRRPGIARGERRPGIARNEMMDDSEAALAWGARGRRSGIARNEMMDDAEAAATLLTLKSPRLAARAAANGPPGNLQELAWGATKRRSARGRLED